MYALVSMGVYLNLESFGFKEIRKVKIIQRTLISIKFVYFFKSLNDQNIFIYFHPAVQKPSLALLHPQAPLAIGSFDVKEKSLSK
jgi:hypothetical protein